MFEYLNKPEYGCAFLEKLEPEINKSQDNLFISNDLKMFLINFFFEAHYRTINREVETKLSGLPIARSLAIFDKLEKELQEEDLILFKQFQEEHLKLPSILRYHQLFTLILKICIKENGVINSKNLTELLQTEAFSLDEASIIKIEILKVLEDLSHTQPEISNFFDKFSDHVKDQSTFLHDDNPFYKKPFYKLLLNNEKMFICPSPYILFWSMAWSPLSKLITYSKRDLSNSIGNSYANYVEDFLNFYSKTKHFNPTTLDDVIKNETVSGEGATFFLAIYRKLLMSSKIQCGSFSILSISQFENLIISNNLESFAKECEEQFQKINHLTSVEFEDALSALGMKFNFPKNTLDLSFFNLYIKRLGV